MVKLLGVLDAFMFLICVSNIAFQYVLKLDREIRTQVAEDLAKSLLNDCFTAGFSVNNCKCLEDMSIFKIILECFSYTFTYKFYETC